MSTTSSLVKLRSKSQDETRYGKIVHSGFLNKKSKGKLWQKRYVVLWEDMALRFYEDESRGTVIGKIKLKNVNEVNKLSEAQCKELDGANPFFFSIVSSSLKKSWQFGCDDMRTLSQWIHILQSALSLSAISGDNAEDFSRARSISSRHDSISVQSLSAAPMLGDDGDEDPFTRPRRNRSVLNGKIKEDAEDDDVKQPEEEEEEEEEEEAEADEHEQILNVEETLNKENKNIVFEGSLERKTNQKVLGKHLWETRYFKLSTHSLSIYTNDKTNIAESIIKLSSMISVNRNTKSDGTDLKDNRFDITTKDQTLNLRTENQIVCQQWIHFLSLERKKHRKSIRTGLESLESANIIQRRSAVSTVLPDSHLNSNHNAKPRQHRDSNSSVRRYKRQRTSRAVDRKRSLHLNDEEDDDEEDDDDEEEHQEEEEQAQPPQNNEEQTKESELSEQQHVADATDGDEEEATRDRNHSRQLSLKSWANAIEKRHNDSVSETEKQKLKDSDSNRQNSIHLADLSKPASFQGFLIRKIGHSSNRIGEKMYFKLSDDTLEFSKIDQILTSDLHDYNYINNLHSSNILGSISIEHIKSVNMVSNENDDEFMIVFNDKDSKTDWILTTEKTDQGNAIKWVNILQAAQKDAKDVAQTINKIGQSGSTHHHDDDDDDEEGDDSTDSEDAITLSSRTRKNKKKKKKLGGQIQALQQMINDETIEELEMARNHELKNANLNDGFEINSLQSSHRTHPSNQASSGCGCLCLK